MSALAEITAGSSEAWLAAIAALHRRAFPEDPWGLESIAQVLAMPGAFGLARPRSSAPGVAVAAAPPGPLAAFALARLIAGEGEILSLAVAPDLRRLGYGRALLTGLEARVAATGGTRMVLEVADSNSPARGLYARLGYHAVGQRPGYYTPPHGPVRDAIVMAKTLGGRDESSSGV